MDLWLAIVLIIVFAVIAGIVAFYAGVNYRKKVAESQIGSAEKEAERIVEAAKESAEAKKKESILEGKDEIHRLRNEADKELNERRREIQRQERRIQQKEETLEKKMTSLEAKDETLNKKLKGADDKLAEAEKVKTAQIEVLETISKFTSEQAKDYLLKTLENELVHEKSVKVLDYEQKTRDECEKKAREIISLAIQRVAADHVTEATVSVVPLPNDEMKGRIIGREGRNIRAIETLTGVDLIIDDTPEAITLSCFEPVRREIARVMLEKLISDGRIHPARIEEMYEKARREVENTIKEEGERAVIEAGVNGIHPELIKLLGRLRYRTSYGQNVLNHSLEVAYLAGIMASELGLDPTLARRAGVLMLRLVLMLPASIKRAKQLFMLFMLTTEMLRLKRLLLVLFRQLMLFPLQDLVPDEKTSKTTLSVLKNLKKSHQALMVLSVALQFRLVEKSESLLSLKRLRTTRWFFSQEIFAVRLSLMLNIRDKLRLIS